MQPPSANQNPPFPVEPISPDLLAWARQTLNEAEVIEQINEIKSGGGCTFESFVDELARRARGK